MTDRYILNKNDGLDTLHREHGDERCNRDDMEDRQTIDAETADALLALGDTRRCSHCYPSEEPS